MILGIVAVVLGINAKKQTGGTKGQAGFVCGLIGIIFAVIFAVGCSICGAVESSSTKTSYTCYGCVGGSCLVSSDVNDAADSLNDLSNALNDLSDAYN